MKKLILYQNYYIDADKARQEELATCLKHNVENPLIDEIILVHSPDITPPQHEKIVAIPFPNRPTYNDFFQMMRDEPGTIHVLANTDIYFDGTLALVKTRGIGPFECFALSRSDLTTSGTFAPHHCRGSQDVWMFGSKVGRIDKANFTLGLPGCDNKIAYLLSRNRYVVTNPCKDITVIHLHNTNKRNYSAGKDTIPPPYFLVYPGKLEAK